LKVFAEGILPALKDKKVTAGSRKVRIVSAGCSSGEEVYTLAMLLLEAGLFIWDWDTVKRVIEAFSRVLAKDGLLFLGHSESLARITDHYQALRFPGTIIYKNRE
jgi:chemotaxis protein methyltransferase CheR